MHDQNLHLAALPLHVDAVAQAKTKGKTSVQIVNPAPLWRTMSVGQHLAHKYIQGMILQPPLADEMHHLVCSCRPECFEYEMSCCTRRCRVNRGQAPWVRNKMFRSPSKPLCERTDCHGDACSVILIITWGQRLPLVCIHQPCHIHDTLNHTPSQEQTTTCYYRLQTSSPSCAVTAVARVSAKRRSTWPTSKLRWCVCCTHDRMHDLQAPSTPCLRTGFHDQQPPVTRSTRPQIG